MMYVKCPYCKKDFDVTDRMCGKIMNCPACKMSIKNPPQKPTSKSSYPHLQIEADNNPAPSVVNNTRQGSPSRVQDRQLDAEQAFQSMLDIKEAQLNRKKSPPPAGCGCLIAFGLALLSFAVGGAMQIEDSGMGYFSVVLLIVSTAGYIITYKKMKKKKDILLQNHSMEMKALVNRIYNSQPLIAQYVKSADELLNITCCDEIIAALV